ncbi:MAG: Hsp20/alpha crystallin family protein [Solobacterium sp.]|nr:Hsp20/alpha crystallin family protein [Solobacterium sp.]
MFDSMFRAPVMGGNSLMKTDVHEKDGKYILDIEVPGYKKEDVEITLYNGTLTISAAKNSSSEEKDDQGKVVRKERYSGSCSRSFYVGEGIRDTDVHATFTDGILKIEIPTEQKKEEDEKKLIQIL